MRQQIHLRHFHSAWPAASSNCQPGSLSFLRCVFDASKRGSDVNCPVCFTTIPHLNETGGKELQLHTNEPSHHPRASPVNVASRACLSRAPFVVPVSASPIGLWLNTMKLPHTDLRSTEYPIPHCISSCSK